MNPQPAAPVESPTIRSGRSTGWKLFLLASLLIGAALRLSFGGDIEYREDQEWTFLRATHAGRSEPWPAIGMRSGANIPNPGASIWVFIALARLTGAGNPPALARDVQVMNVLALAGLMLFAWFQIPDAEREQWLWAGALAAVNPLAVQLHRKIWAQSVLPLFCLILLIAWFHRDRRPGAFTWGFLGAFIGQIHMSGFFYAAALFLWTAACGHSARSRKTVRWGAWVAGATLGAAPLLPWAIYMIHTAALGGAFLAQAEWKRFWFIQYWVGDPSGLSLAYTLDAKFLDFLGGPVIAGRRTFLVAGVHLLMAATALPLLAHYCVQRLSKLEFGAWITGRCSQTALLLSAAFWGNGLLLSISRLRIYRHYLITTFPLEWVWFSGAILAASRRARIWLVILWSCQALISAAFLLYIHSHHGAAGTDYGVGYQWQLR